MELSTFVKLSRRPNPLAGFCLELDQTWYSIGTRCAESNALGMNSGFEEVEALLTSIDVFDKVDNLFVNLSNIEPGSWPLIGTR